VIVDAGKEVEFVSTDPGVVIAERENPLKWARFESKTGVIPIPRVSTALSPFGDH
jgi:hypothetical protein